MHISKISYAPYSNLGSTQKAQSFGTVGFTNREILLAVKKVMPTEKIQEMVGKGLTQNQIYFLTVEKVLPEKKIQRMISKGYTLKQIGERAEEVHDFNKTKEMIKSLSKKGKEKLRALFQYVKKN